MAFPSHHKDVSDFLILQQKRVPWLDLNVLISFQLLMILLTNRPRIKQRLLQSLSPLQIFDRLCLHAKQCFQTKSWRLALLLGGCVYMYARLAYIIHAEFTVFLIRK